MRKQKKAFTLVELIIVITILAILATIAFLSFQWYSSYARDSIRLSDLKTISNWFDIKRIKWSVLPDPEWQTVNIMSWTNNIWKQWYIWTKVTWIIWANWNLKDPLDLKNYTYSVNNTNTKYQLLALLENDQKTLSYNNINKLNISIINKAQAEEVGYYSRFPYQIWDKLWILLSQKNTPIQETNSWNIDLTTWTPATTSYNVVFSNNTNSWTITASWTDLPAIIEEERNNVTSNTNSWTITASWTDSFSQLCKEKWSIYYTNEIWFELEDPNQIDCDSHIVICHWNNSASILKSCDIWSYNLNESWLFFQWWEKYAWNNSSDVNINTNCEWDRDNQSCINWTWKNYFDIVLDNIDSWIDRWYSYSQTDNRWPCPLWYYVPSIQEWGSVILSRWYIYDETHELILDLKLNESWFRSAQWWWSLEETNSSYYWSSTPGHSSEAQRLLIWNNIIDSYFDYRDNAFLIRCFKSN